ncbi:MULTISPECIES: CapA family protein [unclassified Campylobacter]|uniref:CapA family protein n=1 Tax=unclassified Campylobacter TaxID=2593542 RepID=UPI0022EA003A|nr:MULTISPECIES: CapA family protein [unclassified Campylobacter]MDA3053908.1 CapA family protein [Campylobacter sp. VBCF_07 NA4]MDA3060205.1 CapA family protein [Campylobacter sp. VBCF_02 NA5]MDA3069719.1 CapA family protein [Campylobacter sp. VBCF_08 NA3]WBR54949.1 CapA family protein [Campylobacter sp. VBCF_01 NA2]
MKILILFFSFLLFGCASENTLSLIAVGDNLIHSKLIEGAHDKTAKSHDFKPYYRFIKDEIKDKDIKIINQETILIEDKKKLSGYPNFGSPLEVGEAVRDAGFNLIAHATNHALDKGEEGILDSAKFWSSFEDIAYIGISPDQNSSKIVKILKKNNVSVAFLNYTYGLNGHIMPKGKGYLVDLLSDEEKILSDLELAKKHADFVVVLPHWGVEYTHKPTATQKKQAQFLANSGADLIIGTHPHVIQPLELITTDDNRSVPCFYSLGNFISNQDESARMLGAMADIVIEKEGNATKIKSLRAVPLITHISPYSHDFSVHLFARYPDMLAMTHRLRRVGDFKTENLKTLWNSVFPEFEIK